MTKEYAVTASRLHVIMRDLKEMRTTLDPDGTQGGGTETELKGLDDFQKGKAKLTSEVAQISSMANELEELKKKKGGQKDTRVITMQRECQKEIEQAQQLWSGMKAALEKQVQKKKLPKEELNARLKHLEALGREIMELENKISPGRVPEDSDELKQDIERNQKNRQLRDEERAKQRELRRQQQLSGKSETSPESDTSSELRPMSMQAQEFMREKEAKDQEIDAVLDEISRGMTELKAIGIEIGRQFDVQTEMLSEIEEKVDDTNAKFKDANRRLKQLLEKSTGGAERWCPMVVLLVILLGIGGYIFNSVA